MVKHQTRLNIVSSEVLAQVFGDKLLPFETNADGSVDMSVYMEWLATAGRIALEAFKAFSEIETPMQTSIGPECAASLAIQGGEGARMA